MRGKVNSVSGDNIKFIEKEYDSATLYKKGDTALIRGILHNCLFDNTTGTLNMDRWERAYLSDLAEITSSEQALADMVDEVYDPSKTYNKGDTTLYNEVLYICKNDGTTGKWNADLWEQTTLVSILNSNLISEKTVSKNYSISARGTQTIVVNSSEFGKSRIMALVSYFVSTEYILLSDQYTSDGRTGFLISTDGKTITLYLYNSSDDASKSGTINITVI